MLSSWHSCQLPLSRARLSLSPVPEAGRESQDRASQPFWLCPAWVGGALAGRGSPPFLGSLLSAASDSLWWSPSSSLLFLAMTQLGEGWQTNDVFQHQAPRLHSSTVFSSRICLDCGSRLLPVWFLAYHWETNPYPKHHPHLTMLRKACFYHHPHVCALLPEGAAPLGTLADTWEDGFLVPWPLCPWLDGFSQAPDRRVRSSSHRERTGVPGSLPGVGGKEGPGGVQN